VIAWAPVIGACDNRLVWLRLLALAIVTAAAGPQTDGALRLSTAARSLQPGELVVLTISAPAGVAGVEVSAFGRTVPAFPTGQLRWQALIGIDLDAGPGVQSVAVSARRGDRLLSASLTLRIRSRRFARRQLQVDDAFVTPPPEVRARIERESRELERVWTASAPERMWTTPFVRPVDGVALSRFGTLSVYNGQPRGRHGGADFRASEGTPVRAPAGGRIVVARSLYFSGNTVVIDHGLGLFSVLAHLSEFSVNEGESVAAGRVIGLAGATGRVTGPHLHWAVRVDSARIDPLSVLALLGPADQRRAR
jgi:hypothetical protein